MLLNIEKLPNQFLIGLEFNTALYTDERAKQFINHFEQAIHYVLENPRGELSRFSLLSTEELTLIETINNTATSYPKDKSIAQLFRQQVQTNPQQLALIWHDEQITYLELSKEVNQIAAILKQNLFLAGQKVAVLLARSPKQIAAIMAILQVGGSYVPICPSYPNQRIQFILEDSKASFLLTTSVLCPQTLSAPITTLLLDASEILASKNHPEVESTDVNIPAYIMYTSGTTGRPKGTLVGQAAVIRTVIKTNYIDIKPQDRILQLSNFAFDGSVFDIFGALLNGATLILVPENIVQDPLLLLDYINKQQVTLFFVTTALFNLLVNANLSSLTSVRQIIFGGEAASVAQVRKGVEALGPNKLIQVYGPTETTVFASYYPINQVIDSAHYIPIGYPVSNSTLYVLDKDLCPVLPQVTGELYIGGDGVAHSYFNLDSLTNERFIANPFMPHTRMYRTGDLVKRLKNGVLVFIGRNDSQVKIRGYRIELGEIEVKFQQISEVDRVILAVEQDNQGDKFISAYYTLSNVNTPITAKAILQKLKQTLPSYMLPSHIQPIANVPISTGGKVDFRALAALRSGFNRNSVSTSTTSTLDQISALILDKMQQILDLNQMESDDDFFYRGGHSLKAITLAAALDKGGIKVRVADIFKFPTARSLAKHVLAMRTLQDTDEISVEKSDNKEIIRAINTKVIEQKVNLMLSQVQSGHALMSSIVQSSPVLKSFPLSAIQTFHFKKTKRHSGFVTRISKKVSESFIRLLITHLMLEHQLLHSILIPKEQSAIWVEHDLFDLASYFSKHLCYFDCVQDEFHNNPEQQNRFIQQLFSMPYGEEQLQWRVCSIKLDSESHLLIFGFDHLAFDGRSAEIIRSHLETLIYTQNESSLELRKSGNSSVQKYSDYVNYVQEGPLIAVEEILSQFHLASWSQSNLKLLKKMKQGSTSDSQEFKFKISLESIENSCIWENALVIAMQLMFQYSELDELAMGMVSHGRHYNSQHFNNCVGEFLDIIPIRIQNSCEPKAIIKLLDFCREYRVNFMELLHNKKPQSQFKKITKFLAPSYLTDKNSMQMVLFNFQGFITENEHVLFDENKVESGANAMLSQLSISIFYDESNVHINLRSVFGLDSKRLQACLAELEIGKPQTMAGCF
ncbi:MAG: amino acid adenylation domain-containing protein [Tatlockia sp.]|nr:amino acid adenylation domain-containing protein [Tatlockia sp.]